jgi:hypothetical protein
MQRLLLACILALAFTCAVSLTVPSQHDHTRINSLSERLLQSDGERPLG